MARIAGVNIPTNKRVLIALQYIHGIGSKFATDICTKVGIPAERRANAWGRFDAAFSRALGARGWIGLTWPTQYGGAGRSALERYVLLEELLAAWPGALMMVSHDLHLLQALRPTQVLQVTANSWQWRDSL